VVRAVSKSFDDTGGVERGRGLVRAACRYSGGKREKRKGWEGDAANQGVWR